MTYPHATCLNCDKPARIDSDFCSLECLNECGAQLAAQLAARTEIDDNRDPGDEA